MFDFVTGSGLRDIISAAVDHHGGKLGDWSVLSAANDPYRLDTPANHRDGSWFAEQLQSLGVELPLHNRGIHYAFAASGEIIKPDGNPYLNNDDNWHWLEKASKKARWLGYVPFDSITDERNAPPVFFAPEETTPSVSISTEFDIQLPEELTLEIYVADFEARQKYSLWMIGEKSSLRNILEPIAEAYQAGLFLPTGEISDSQVHHLASSINEDGRPARVFYFSDFDPAGYEMPANVSRKLQALRDIHFPDLELKMYRAAMTEDQVRSLQLPSTPLKDTERRAPKWLVAKGGLEQTEIDALATLRPDELRRIAEEIIAPFWDATLAIRVREARLEFRELAQKRFDEQVDQGVLDQLRSRGEEVLEDFREKLSELQGETACELPDDIELPDPEVPQAVEHAPPECDPIFSTDDDWKTATIKLKEVKNYVD